MMSTENRSFTDKKYQISSVLNYLSVVGIGLLLSYLNKEKILSTNNSLFYLAIAATIFALIELLLAKCSGEIANGGTVAKLSVSPIVFYFRLGLTVFILVAAVFFMFYFWN